MTNIKNALAAAGLMLFAGSATAVPINGSVGFTGDFDIWDDDTAAIVNDFTVGEEILVNNPVVTGTVTGSFAAEGIDGTSVVSHSDIIYSPTGGITDLWSVGSFTFDLTSMVVTFINSNTIVLDGAGTITSTDPDLDASTGTWNFTANVQGANFTWSSSANVPAPAVLALLGMGLLGFGAARKLRK